MTANVLAHQIYIGSVCVGELNDCGDIRECSNLLGDIITEAMTRSVTKYNERLAKDGLPHLLCCEIQICRKTKPYVVHVQFYSSTNPFVMHQCTKDNLSALQAIYLHGSLLAIQYDASESELICAAEHCVAQRSSVERLAATAMGKEVATSTATTEPLSSASVTAPVTAPATAPASAPATSWDTAPSTLCKTASAPHSLPASAAATSWETAPSTLWETASSTASSTASETASSTASETASATLKEAPMKEAVEEPATSTTATAEQCSEQSSDQVLHAMTTYNLLMGKLVDKLKLQLATETASQQDALAAVKATVEANVEANVEARMSLERAKHKDKAAELLAGWKRAEAREREVQETACELRETVERLRDAEDAGWKLAQASERELQETACELRKTVQRLQDAEARTCLERANHKEQVKRVADLHAEWDSEWQQVEAREREHKETVQRLQDATKAATKDAQQSRDAMTNLRKAIAEVVGDGKL